MFNSGSACSSRHLATRGCTSTTEPADSSGRAIGGTARAAVSTRTHSILCAMGREVYSRRPVAMCGGLAEGERVHNALQIANDLIALRA
uniref:Uncharacterized protein n=1 Tax=uncultured marine virus TaxID=186617 RepID=A0A0F7LA02_9VIRU|nr:hypothetical protein [uncultured marine virus]